MQILIGIAIAMLVVALAKAILCVLNELLWRSDEIVPGFQQLLTFLIYALLFLCPVVVGLVSVFRHYPTNQIFGFVTSVYSVGTAIIVPFSLVKGHEVWLWVTRRGEVIRALTDEEIFAIKERESHRHGSKLKTFVVEYFHFLVTLELALTGIIVCVGVIYGWKAIW